MNHRFYRSAVVFAFLWCLAGPACQALHADPSKVAVSADATVRLTQATINDLNALLKDPRLADARLGVSVRFAGFVRSYNQPTVYNPPARDAPALFESDADKRFVPASNMKLYTAALALHTLGPNAVFTTEVLADTAPVGGVVRGALVLRGGGDPSLDVGDLRDMARRVRAMGIRQVGDIVAGGSAYGGGNINGRYPDGWTLDDALWDYGAEVSALAMHRNEVDVTLIGGDRPGAPVTVSEVPYLPGFQLGRELLVQVTTGGAELAKMSDDDLVHVDRALAASTEPTVLLTGALAPRHKLVLSLAVPAHEQWIAKTFAAELLRAGVRIGGMRRGGMPLSHKIVALVSHKSAPLPALLSGFLKPSDNLYGEMLLRDTALHYFGPGQGTAQRGHELLRNFMASEAIDSSALHFTDGSGLSRYDIVTPDATTRLLSTMAREPGMAAIFDALPIAGIDGTLKKRMKGTPAEANVRAKTGTFSYVSCLSGYVTTSDGCRLSVSVLTNFARNGNDARDLQNKIFVVLAGATLDVGVRQ